MLCSLRALHGYPASEAESTKKINIDGSEGVIGLDRSVTVSEATQGVNNVVATFYSFRVLSPKFETTFSHSFSVEEEFKAEKGTLFTKKVGVDHTCLTAA